MNAVIITGYLKEKVDMDFRDFVYETPFSDDGLLEERHIKIKYWTPQHQNRLTILPDATKVLVHGHLEQHEKFGTILLAEELEVIG